MRSLYYLILKWVLNAKAALFVMACTIYIMLLYFLSDTLRNPDTEVRLELVIFVVIILVVAIYSLNKITVSEEKYRSLYDCHVDAIITVNLKGKVINLNQQYERFFGYKLEHYENKQWNHFFDPLQQEYLSYYYMEAMRGNSWSLEMNLQHQQGDLIEVHMTFIPMKANDKIVGIYILCKDITEINKNKKEIERLHKHYQLLLNSVTEGIVGVNENGTISFWNRAAENMLGWSSDEALGYPLMEKIGHCQACSISSDDTSKLIICREIQCNLFEGHNLNFNQMTLIRKDRSSFPAILAVSPILQGNGNQTGIVCTFKDITDYKEQEELLRKSDRLAAAGQLAAGVAHEIRNPLTALKGFLQLFPKTNFKEHHYVSIMERELLRIESIVNEFLFIAKPQTTVFKANQIEDILADTIELLKLQAYIGSIRVTMSIKSQQIPSILCDAHQLKQVFINVMKNAIESISNGGEIVIHLEYLIEHHKIKISIKDNGCGIAPDRLEQLGEPFYSTKERGTGLGLMVSYKIIESHGGTISFDSQLHKGTEVQILLPVPTTEAS
ncbi:PAS domain S-box protein [Paenibacillus albiflavus]|uniref:histidine kinase n=1 Tax=Paenibacillus albiflavus TaxID=2545760 RepID=A0A4R4EA65_9BACL|nr:PAS domain S-box protein [Paenibacillus albiflavus]TCZ75800.1 PAS domain S-box protein [Paenibacillus albiflavus]